MHVRLLRRVDRSHRSRFLRIATEGGGVFANEIGHCSGLLSLLWISRQRACADSGLRQQAQELTSDGACGSSHENHRRIS
jgi:hypothetical protein